jgi:hypothetical protein
LAEQHGRSQRLWADVYAEAMDRSRDDPLFAARVKSVAALVRDRTGRAAGELVDQWVRTGAAVALVVAERPELLTGEPTGREPAHQVLARVLLPLARETSFPPQATSSRADELARTLLNALELAGYEVTVRADRFASMQGDWRQLRIPLRGVCSICRGYVDRSFDGQVGELLIGPWRHRGINADEHGGHEPAGVVEA